MKENTKKLIVFTDIGDTIIDEGTEVHDENRVVLSADCIPGARETYRKLHDAGYQIVMVADGLVQSFHNTMTQNGLDELFTAKIISEEIGEEKPSEKMFRAAMDSLGLKDEDKARVVMIGNNVERDIPGANRFGIRSVLLEWSPRRPFDELSPEMRATYKIGKPEELLPLVDALEKSLDSEPEYDRTLTSARVFAGIGRLEDWVHAYLTSDGNNQAFSDGLKLCPRYYYGPLKINLDALTRICGPEEGMPYLVDKDGFERRVAWLMEEIRNGADLPPLIVKWTGDGYELNDGNHRYEAFRRLGIEEVWAVFWMTEAEEAASFREMRKIV